VAWAPAGVWRPKRWFRTLARLPFGHVAFWPLIRIMSRFWYEPSWAGREAALRDAFAYYRAVHEVGVAQHVVSLAAEQMAERLFDVAERMPEPTLLVVGDADHALGMNAGVHALAKILPRAALRVFAGGHALAAEVPVALAEAAVAFLDGTTG